MTSQLRTRVLATQPEEAEGQGAWGKRLWGRGRGARGKFSPTAPCSLLPAPRTLPLPPAPMPQIVGSADEHTSELPKWITPAKTMCFTH